jgi:hypothetical protein
MSELTKRFRDLCDEKCYADYERIGLTLRERRMIAVALEIADAAVVHHDTLVSNARNYNPEKLMSDAGETSAEIYKKAEIFKHWRDS